MTMLLVSSRCLSPPSSATPTLPGPRMVAVPWKVSILFFLSRKATPSTLPLTPWSLKASILARSSFGATSIPMAAKPWPRLLVELGGVQQRLGGDAADVEAGAAVGGALLDHGHLQAELGGTDGADVAAGSGADDDQIVGHP